MQDTFLTGTSWKISILYYISLHWAASFRCVGWLDWGWGACPTFAQMLIRDLIPYLMIQVNVQARRWRCSYLSLALKPSPNRDVRNQKKREEKLLFMCLSYNNQPIKIPVFSLLMISLHRYFSAWWTFSCIYFYWEKIERGWRLWKSREHKTVH